MTCICSSAITTAAIVNRTARNRKADDSSSAFFTTTNVTPQISEQNISDKSAFFRASIRIPSMQSATTVYPQTRTLVRRSDRTSLPPRT